MNDATPNRWVMANANIITMDEADTRSECLAVENGRILRIGGPEAVREQMGAGWPVRDMDGRTVLPGFIDTHGHLMLTGFNETAVHLDDAKTIDEIFDRIGERARTTDKGDWVRGSYLNEQHLKEKRMPDRRDLDRVCPDHPVYLLHATCHFCSFNTRALDILSLPPEAEGMDADADGPTGVVRDPAILTLVHPAMGRLTPEAEKIDFIRAAGRMALRRGITTLHALDGGDLGPGDTEVIHANLDRSPVRLVLYNQSMDLAEVRRMGLPRVGGCICADGAFEAHTAALFEPYADEPDNDGALTYSQEVMDDFVMAAHRKGLQIAVHCESERSIEQVLRAMEKALWAEPRSDHRHRIEHLELPTWNQIERMARAGITAAMQPAFIPAFIGAERMETYEVLLGKVRLDRVHPYRTLLDAGVPICGGSDSPVTPYNPLAGIQAAATHPNPAQRVTVREALAMFTRTAAWSAFEEADKGTLAPGRLADFVVLSADPLETPAERIGGIGVEDVYIGGHCLEL